ncbi:MAG TPA: phosphotransferase [Gammaproteobacteria bacterium]|nr:phosphotransferase [Gammaproteobacteria bacterium]
MDRLADLALRTLHDAIARGQGRVLGKGYQATVELYSTPAGDVVVKRAHGNGPLGPLYRHLLRREHAVYEQLAGVPGVPRTYGLIDGEHLALEYIAGPSLRAHERELADRPAFFAALLETLRAMHAAGVAHADLKRKANVIVGPNERPWLIDFGIAARRGKSALGRAWFEHQVQADYNAWIKLKYGRRVEPAEAADVLSPEDAALYRPLWTERIARAIRVPWQAITLRRPRRRWRARREGSDKNES